MKILAVVLSTIAFAFQAHAEADALAVKLVKSYYHLSEVDQSVGILLQKIDEGHTVIPALNAAKSKVKTAQTLLKADIDELGNEPALVLLSQRLVLNLGMQILGVSVIRSQLLAAGDLDEDATTELNKISSTLKSMQESFAPTGL